jgi:arylformamidase
VQAKASSWRGDPARVLLGHWAGAHLVSLLVDDPRIVTGQGGAPRLGTIVLDSAAFDVVENIQGKHYRFYDRVFGKDRSFWTEASPYHRLIAAPAPMFVVCSSRRSDTYPQARTFASKAVKLDGRVTVLPMDLLHAQVNKELGQPSEYTTAVEDFMCALGLLYSAAENSDILTRPTPARQDAPFLQPSFTIACLPQGYTSVVPIPRPCRRQF